MVICNDIQNRSFNIMNVTEHVDVLIYGTGMTQCILAATLARRGLKVFIVDKCHHYGKSFASIPLQDIENSDNVFDDIFDEYQITIKKSELYSIPIRTLDMSCFPILKSSDIFSEMINSNITDYDIEFASIDNMTLDIESDKYDQIKPFPIPLSKEDIFVHPYLDIIEKRQWMKRLSKLFEVVRDGCNNKNDENFDSWIESIINIPELNYNPHSLSMPLNEKNESLLRFMTNHCLARLNGNTVSKQNGIERLVGFLSSMKKFNSNSPYLIPYHASSEIIQGFARKASVYGASIYLGADIQHISLNPPKIIIQDNNSSISIEASSIVADVSLLDDSVDIVKREYRAILVTNKPILLHDDASVAFHHQNTESFIYNVIERRINCDSSYYYVNFFTSYNSMSSKELFQPIVKSLYNPENILFALFGSNPLYGLTTCNSTPFIIQDIYPDAYIFGFSQHDLYENAVLMSNHISQNIQ